MGLVEKELGSTVLPDGTEVKIEYNHGDVIHLHIGKFRIDFSPEEFNHFIKVIKEGKEDILEVKDGIQ